MHHLECSNLVSVKYDNKKKIQLFLRQEMCHENQIYFQKYIVCFC